MEVDGSQHAQAIFLWPKWLVMLTEKLRFVFVWSGVVPWDTLRKVWRDGAMGCYNLDAPFAHNGGNVPFQIPDRSIKCMHRISFVTVVFGHEVVVRYEWHEGQVHAGVEVTSILPFALILRTAYCTLTMPFIIATLSQQPLDCIVSGAIISILAFFT